MNTFLLLLALSHLPKYHLLRFRFKWDKHSLLTKAKQCWKQVLAESFSTTGVSDLKKKTCLPPDFLVFPFSASICWSDKRCSSVSSLACILRPFKSHKSMASYLSPFCAESLLFSSCFTLLHNEDLPVRKLFFVLRLLGNFCWNYLFYTNVVALCKWCTCSRGSRTFWRQCVWGNLALLW